MPDQAWTRTPPTVAGFYWWHRLEELTMTTVVKASKRHVFSYETATDELLFEIPGDESLYTLDHFDALWFGPIDQPELP